MTTAQRALSRGFSTLAAAAPGGIVTFRDSAVAAIVEFTPLDNADGSRIPSQSARQSTRIRILASLAPRPGETFTDEQDRTHRIKSVRVAGTWVDCECEVSP